MKEFKCTPRHITYIYVFATILWAVILISFDISGLSLIDYLILLIPIVLFLIAVSSSRSLVVEEYTSKTNILATGLLVALPLLIWLRDNAICNKKLFNKIIVTSLILSLLSMTDIWVSEKYLFAVKHLKSAFQVMAIVLLIFAFFRFYTECPELKNPKL